MLTHVLVTSVVSIRGRNNKKNDVTAPQYKTNPYYLDNKDVGLILLPPDSTVPS